MDLSQRKKKILAAVVDEYIQTAEPVGSKKIASDKSLGLSSATIRNEMAELESMGYLEQPHTSAGRVPSALGYRIYVNELMMQHKLSLDETDAINRSLNLKVQELDKLLAQVGNLASQLTSYTAYSLSAPSKATITRFDLIYVDSSTFIVVCMLSNNSVKNKLIHLPISIEADTISRLNTVFNANLTGLTSDMITPKLLESMELAARDADGLVAAVAVFAIEILGDVGSGEAYLAGVPQLLRQPEFRDPDKAHELISYLSDSQTLLKLPAPTEEGEVKVLIGPENLAEELKDSSVIMASYSAGDNMQGLVGIVGPTRMDYGRLASKLQYLAGGLGRFLTDDKERPPNDTQQEGDFTDEHER